MPAPPLQNFIDRVTVVVASWLNAVDRVVTTVFEQTTTKAAARAAMVNDLTATSKGFEIINGGTGAVDGLDLFFRGTDAGIVNAYVVTTTGLANPLLALNTGSILRVAVQTVNTGAATVVVNGFGPFAIVDYQGNALGGGELTGLVDLSWNGTAWQMRAMQVGILYKRTPAEVAAGVTPTNYSYLPGDARRYGAKGDGVTNDTQAILNMYLACIKAANTGATTSSFDGYVPAGTYLINEGQIVLDTGFLDMAWPVIRTAGYNAVFYKGANFADAPILTLSNGTATGTAFHGWRGGSHDGVTFLTARSSGSNSHGISIAGLWGILFGAMKGINLFGDLIHQPQKLFGGTDPDPYNIAFCQFYLLETVNCAWTYNNLNTVGSSGNTFLGINSNGQTGGVIFDGGSDGNTYIGVSIGPGLGWGFDTGANSLKRCTMLDAEFDGMQFGLRINAGFGNRFTGIRFVHEFRLGPNTAANYWPRVAMDITGLASPNLTNTRIDSTHRVDPGGAHKDLGVFCDFHNSGACTSDVEVYENVLDNAGITYTDKDFWRNMNNTLAGVFRDGRRISDNRVISLTKLAGNGTTSIPNSGFTTTAGLIAFPTVRYDPNSLTQTVSGVQVWVAPFTGAARFKACMALTVAAGTRARMAVMEVFANSIATLGSLVAGTGYTNGTYNNVQLTGGTGQTATANITVAGGVVTTVTLVGTGGNYTVGDVLSAYNGDIGGTGTGFSINVATVTALTISGSMIFRVDYAISAAVQSYSIEGECAVVQGRAYCLSADQSTAGAVVPSVPSGSFEADLYFEAEMSNAP